MRKNPADSLEELSAPVEHVKAGEAFPAEIFYHLLERPHGDDLQFFQMRLGGEHVVLLKLQDFLYHM
jgi:hypothetical protein